jgi:hypothetical protein
MSHKVNIHHFVEGAFTVTNMIFDSFDEAKAFTDGFTGHHSLRIFNDNGDIVHSHMPSRESVTLDVPASLSITVN